MAHLPAQDFGNARVFSAYARENITGGMFVYTTGGTNVVNASGMSSFAATDILVARAASGALCVGMAVETQSSGGLIPVQTAGWVIVPCNADTISGYPVQVDGAEAVSPAGSATLVAGYSGRVIGRAMTGAASGGYLIVNLNL